MTPDLDAVRSRIRALLAKTVANGCTEGEALAAAEKAFELMRRHNLSHDEVYLGRAKLASLKNRRSPLDDLWIVVATVCRCQCIITKGVGLEWLYIGPEPWPDIAVWLQGVLTSVHARALVDFRKSLGYRRRRVARTRAAARRQFTVGFVDQVRQKLWALARPDIDAIQRDLDMVQRATAAELKGTRDLAKLGHASNARDLAGDRAAGERAGRQANVNWGVTGVAPKLIGGGAA